MSKTDEIKRALVQMIAECTATSLIMSTPVEMYGPYFMVDMPDRKYYFEIVFNEVDEGKFDITENYQP